jgi:hypothetical protein
VTDFGSPSAFLRVGNDRCGILRQRAAGVNARQIPMKPVSSTPLLLDALDDRGYATAAHSLPADDPGTRAANLTESAYNARHEDMNDGGSGGRCGRGGS